MSNSRNSQANLIAKVLDSVNDQGNIDSQKTIVPGDGISPRPNEFLESQKLINKAYFDIVQARQTIDYDNGIASKLVKIDTKKVWVRYGKSSALRNDSLAHQEILQDNYIRLFNAYVIGAVTVARLYGFSEDVIFLTKLNQIAVASQKLILDAIKNGDKAHITDTMEKVKFQLMETLQFTAPASETIFKSSQSNSIVSKMLDRAKDWAGMEDDTYTVVTVMDMDQTKNTELTNNKLVLMDEPCAKLTDTQLTQFKALDDQKWFQDLKEKSVDKKTSYQASEDSFEQRLVRHYMPFIMAGRVMPSQLRAIAPACRNFYKQTSAVVTPNGNITTFSPVYHSGTDAYVSPQAHAATDRTEETAKEVTKNNFRQIKENIGTDAVVIFNLNSHLADEVAGRLAELRKEDYQKDDSKILQLSKAAANELEDEGIYDAKVCANGFRRVPLLEKDDFKAIDELMKIIEGNIEEVGYITQNFNQETLEIRKWIRAVQAARRFHKASSLLDSNLEGLSIISKLTKLCDLNNQLAEKFKDELPNSEKQLKTIACKFNCASGDNRTGIVEVICATDRFFEHFRTNASRKLGKEIATTLAKFEHIQVMKGHQGCTFGTESIRSKSMGSLPKRLRYIAYYLSSGYGDLKNIFYRNVVEDPNRRPQANVSPSANAAKVRGHILGLGNNIPLSDARRNQLNNLKQELLHELKRGERKKNNGKREAIRNDIYLTVEKTQKLLECYHERTTNIAAVKNPQVRKQEFDDFLGTAKTYKQDVARLRTSQKATLLCLTLLGGLVGAVGGALLVGAAGIIFGHVGVSIGAVTGAIAGAKLGVIVGAAAAVSLAGISASYANKVGLKTCFFSERQKQGTGLAAALTEDVKRTYKQSPRSA